MESLHATEDAAVFNALTAETLEAMLPAMRDAVILCFKKLCPHCKNMEKVVEKFARATGVPVYLLDSEEEPAAMTALGAERVPTVVVVRAGRVAAMKTGLMNPKEMAAFHAQARGRGDAP